MALRYTRRLAALLFLMVLASCDVGETAPDGPVFADDLTGRFQARDRYVPLAQALALTGLDRDLAQGTFTVLAPTRIALRYVGDDFSPVLFSDAERATLRRVLRHHIVPARLGADAFTDGATFTDLDGGTLTVRTIGPVVTVNGVTLDALDPTEATNGVAYPLADVLFDTIETKERVRLSPLLSGFRDGLSRTGVATPFEALDAVTVLAPSEDAFRGLGTATRNLLTASANRDVYTRALQAHVLPGDVDLAARVGQTVTTLAGDELPVTQDANRTLFVAGVRVVAREATADGRLYVVAAPILSTLTVGQRIRVRPDLSSYLMDLQSVPGALDRLSDREAGSTVFAPANTIYLVRSEVLRQTLAEPGQADVVRRFAGVHLVPQRLGAADLQSGSRATALDGTVLSIDREPDGRVLIEGRFIGEPIQQVNGRLYTLSTAPFLPNTNVLDTALLSDSFVRFFRLVQREGLVGAYRSRVRTLFVLADRPVRSPAPPPVLELEESPDARQIILRTASEEFIPTLDALPSPYAFQAFNGDTRMLYRGLQACGPAGPQCSPGSTSFEPVFQIDPTTGDTLGVVPSPSVQQGVFTQDRSGVYHILASSDFLRPEPRSGRAYRPSRTARAVRPR